MHAELTTTQARTLWLVLLLALPSAAAAEPVGTVLIPVGDTWLYLDDGTNQGTSWRAPGFADGGWSAGPAQLGYGDGDEATTVSFGPNASDKYVTTYFRRHFDVVDPGSIQGLDVSLLRDDGAVVYLNGIEIYRSNLPTGPIDHLTFASFAEGGAAESTFYEVSVPAGGLVAGDNVIAVEIHQANPSSSDISFDFELTTAPPPPPPGLARAPYLQVGTPSSVIVRWRTSTSSDSRVRYGPSPGNLTESVSSAALTTEHELTLSGLQAATRYFYAVGTSGSDLAGDDADHWFDTAPALGTAPPIRIWVIGDSGQCATSAAGCTDAGDVRDAYLAFAGSDRADVWLLLGDNAYNSGTDTQYTDGFFDVYPEVMRNSVVWPVPGNHEFGASNSPTQTGPYYESFSLPTGAPGPSAGGLPSGTEAYYSFDHGNVHFVALDSHDTDRSAPANPETNICPSGQGGAMYQWLCADLAATDKDWIIAYWHYPPYTRGSHNSDSCSGIDVRICEMRERFLPVLESFGVDVHLSGHSHSYERSVLIDGHYGFSGDCSSGQCFVDGGDGDPLGDGAYEKATLGAAPHEGAVFSVVGSSSKLSGGALNHPVMEVSLNQLGSLVLDVNAHQLDGYFVNDSQLTMDHFRIVKGPACADGVDNDGDGLADLDDPGCSGAGDTSERGTGIACDDGIDNDGDGAADYPHDVGCPQLGGLENPQCNDGIDNDGDGAIDWDGGPGGGTADSQCGQPTTDREAAGSGGRGCGLGFELALLLPLMMRARRRRWAPSGRARSDFRSTTLSP